MKNKKYKKKYFTRYNTNFFKSDEDFINEVCSNGYELIAVTTSTFEEKKFYFKKVD